MRELTKSTLSYTWAMSLFGVQQAVNLLAPPDPEQPTRQANDAFYSVRQAAQNQFDDLIFGAFQIGDEVQRGAANLFFDALTLRAFSPGYISRLTSDVAEQSRETLRLFSSGENARLAWQELRNNYEVFNLVKHVSSLLNISEDDRQFDLARLVDEAYALGAYPDLWAVEGLGHLYALTFWGKGRPIRGILRDERADALPAKSLTMMHAGMGLGFAQQLMNTITPYRPEREIRRVVAEFIALVDDNARDGYEGAAYESLGLVTRFWHPQMVGVVESHLRDIAPHALGYFWHGVGRSLYFLPIYFVPGLLSAWLAVEREAPHELARLNMIAGLTWATTIVNVRQPEIMENLLRNQGEQVARTPAFVNGVMSTLIMGIDITPDDIYITRFLEHRPDPSDRRVNELWDALVRRPGQEAVYRVHPALQRHERLGEVFQYHPSLSDFAGRLESETARSGR
ncbi:MAG TPA: hypothetical protein VEZ40_12740 [Pyrinomonadaceae bacterium]|nr:hypothetical protein [Pyrinomonadaceae bacterium]